ncbi:hypothetical protein B9N50_07730 [Finegoldia magna]|nr:hypothetical protein B9N50_07730 [Finegoldia magna]
MIIREGFKLKLKLKDVIIVSLLGVVGFIISMISSTITQMFGTYGVFVHVSIGSFLCAPIYFVMCHKIPKHGVVFIYYLLAGIIYSIMGFVPMLLIMIIAGLLGELCIGSVENFENDKNISISYVISQLIYALHGFFFILVFGVNGLVKTFPNLFTTEKAQMIKDTFFNPKNMLIILLVEIIAAILGTILGKFIYNKFFNKNTKRKEMLS